ncbi:MAG: carbamoyl-phosphate synthase large subunit [Alphaproteobacteria bacterium]|nr:carbamoyl-phosphate synthase large subunit [Alphaproteobacteria bacterium]
MTGMIRKLLIANRAEIAIRIARTAAEMGIATVGVYSEDDATSLHTRKVDTARPLSGSGPAAYLDIGQIVAAAREAGCDAVHPGYGFLSENADFAQRCAEAGLTFVGPRPETLAAFGDKARARALAQACKIPVPRGTSGPTSLDEARLFIESLGAGGPVMLKAVAGGGGRGMRPVHDAAELDQAFARCASEAQQAFGNGDLYVEELLPRVRHIEVQVAGDGTGAAVHLWDRDCSLQRQRQKIVEIAPAAHLPAEVRDGLLRAAVSLAAAARYANLGTVEFLVEVTEAVRPRFFFVEANARLQVEHTVTEEVLGLDLVRLQLALAGGRTLAALGLTQDKVPAPRGTAVQARINMETMAADGTSRPAGGTLGTYEPPSGPGIRVDGFGYAGYRTGVRFDSLLAKLIVHAGAGDLKDAAAKAYRALCEFRIAGVASNIGFLQNLLGHADVAAGRLHTRFVEEHIAALLAPPSAEHTRLYFEPPGGATAQRLAGVKLDSSDPLAVLALGKQDAPAAASLPGAPVAGATPDAIDGPEGTTPLIAPMQGTIVSLSVGAGDAVRAGQPVLVMEAMKMEHVIAADTGGVVRTLTVAQGDTVFEGHPLAFIEPGEVAGAAVARDDEGDLDAIRPDLAEVLKRQAITQDAQRPDAVARRRKTGQRTARENIADLCDPGSFVEYGALAVAARRQRNTLEELIERTPADGMVMGLGRVNGDLFPDERARVAAIAYDYTVLAGTQGYKNHEKKDRMFELAAHARLPIVFFTEGGGGRPGDTDGVFAGQLHVRAFELFGKLSGLVPLVGVVSGRCFAGNAVMLGCCDVIIATANSNIGMGGPAMIEGGGLGIFRPDDVGPMSVQVDNGVVDIAVADEAEAVAAARKYLGYFQGAVENWTCADQRKLRKLIPENRLRAYDVRKVIATLADTDSVLELRPRFGRALITAFMRIEGRPFGVLASNPMHIGGAIDADAADKAARFMQLCDAFDIPLLSLCDTPGNMVGPEAEKAALVRHCCRVFVTGANLGVPLFSVVLRKAYGLGAQGMVGGSFRAPFMTVAWPTAEFGPMGLEGAVKLGYRNEIAAITDPAERKAFFERMVAQMYEQGKGLSAATLFEIDDVIDPADTRRWIMGGLRSLPAPAKREGKKRAWVDTW